MSFSRLALVPAAVLLFAALPAQSQTIYPLTRAEIMTGAKFDFKVEFPDAPAASVVSVTINGQDAAKVFGAEPKFVEHEDGGNLSAYWIRQASLPKAGKYVVEAKAGDKTATVTWELFDTNKRKAKNVILFIGDGMSIAHRVAARVLSKGIHEGRYGGELSFDDMDHMALVSTSGTDSLVTDSANSMSAYTTGHKSCVNALGVYCAANKANQDHPKVETISELVKRQKGMAVGVVTNTEIEDATPAGMVSHTRKRSDYNDIVEMFYKVQPDVIMGGGSPNFLPKSTPGSKRTDETDYFKKFEQAGYAVATTKTEMLDSADKPQTSRMLALFNTGNVDGALDRRLLKKGSVSKFGDQPDLTDQVRTALKLLSKNDKGFILMVESGRIDKYTHSLDWERAAFDTIMLSNAVQIAKDFASRKDDTLVIVVADHAHPVSIAGTYDDERPGTTAREKLGVYQDAKFPNYPKADPEGYPTSVDVSRRLAFTYGLYPDYCETTKPHLDGENVPAVAKAGEKDVYVANEKYCSEPGSFRREGTLPANQPQGVHAADDVILTASGPGSEQFRGRIDNTRVFRYIANALDLARKQ